MSSLATRIARRGGKIGVTNPKHPPRNRPVRYGGPGSKVRRKPMLAEVRARPKRKLRIAASVPPRPDKSLRAINHRLKMNRKAERRERWYRESRK